MDKDRFAKAAYRGRRQHSQYGFGDWDGLPDGAKVVWRTVAEEVLKEDRSHFWPYFLVGFIFGVAVIGPIMLNFLK